VVVKSGFEPSTTRPLDGPGLSVMPLVTASAAKSASIFDDESDDREPEDDGKKQMRGKSIPDFARNVSSHICCLAPASLPPKKYENLFQDEQDVDDL
jgi:hypothetical protein